VKGVLCTPSKSFWIDKWFDDLVELEDGPGPAVGHQNRNGCRTLRTLVYKVKVDISISGGVLVKGVETTFPRAPVITVFPIGTKLLEVTDRRTVLPVRTYLVRPPGSLKPLAEGF
jgi:hypothetical protein